MVQDKLGRVRKFIDENPMKAYGLIFVSGDIFFSMNILYDASILWFLGAMLGILAHGNKILHGKGAPDLKSDDLAITFDEFLKTVINTAKYAAGIFKKNYWDDLLKELQSFNWGSTKGKLKKSLNFREHPLDIGWVLIGVAGLLYFIDSINIFFLREYPSLLQSMIGLFILSGAVIAFVTNRNDLAGRLFASVSFLTFASGLLGANLPLMIAALLFFYANYLIGKTDSEFQSSFVVKPIEAVEILPEEKKPENNSPDEKQV